MKRYRILWVEDDTRYCDDYVSLWKNKYNIDARWEKDLVNGESKIRSDEKFDLIMLDFKFDDSVEKRDITDGSDLAQIVRKCPHRSEVPILMLSMIVVAPGEYKMMEDGMHCIGKPVEPSTLACIIKAIIEGGDVSKVLNDRA